MPCRNPSVKGYADILVIGRISHKEVLCPAGAITPNRRSCRIQIKIIVQSTRAVEHSPRIERGGASFIEGDTYIVIVVAAAEDDLPQGIQRCGTKNIVAAKEDRRRSETARGVRGERRHSNDERAAYSFDHRIDEIPKSTAEP